MSKKNYNYIVVSGDEAEASVLRSAIIDEYHMNVGVHNLKNPIKFNSQLEHVVIVACTPKDATDLCKQVLSLSHTVFKPCDIVCVCVLPELYRQLVVTEKRKIMEIIDKDYIIFVKYDEKSLSYSPELTDLAKFWRDMERALEY